MKTNFLLWRYNVLFAMSPSAAASNELWSDQTLISNSESQRGKTQEMIVGLNWSNPGKVWELDQWEAALENAMRSMRCAKLSNKSTPIIVQYRTNVKRHSYMRKNLHAMMTLCQVVTVTTRLLHIFSPYRAVNTLRLGYTNQSVNAV